VLYSLCLWSAVDICPVPVGYLSYINSVLLLIISVLILLTQTGILQW